eukprot:CAMPEP_0119035378 /NCGR_PEP_ID=MMETSP1177-20130426/2298_1 /TAXON_ID=2985 /ORGANISM="Ochromonas sp, Strain CCMP1899" /LENGTH=277 /DNA_ID=CAMNT_0006993471 /DNA_START=132 /DNA_END=964 /DNA_ORIENTATION=-
MAENEKEISRLLSSRGVRSVFGLSNLEGYNEIDLRKKYRKSALLVHPDKNRCEGAEEAIKTLNNALEVLLSQLVFQPQDIPVVSRYDSRNTFRKKEKTAEAAAEKADNSSDKSKDINKNNNPKKSSKIDFVKEFLEEEKKFLAENLKKKVNHESRMKMKMNRKDEEEKLRALDLSEECERRQEGIEERANSWKHFSNKKVVATTNSSVSNTTSSTDPPMCTNSPMRTDRNDPRVKVRVRVTDPSICTDPAMCTDPTMCRGNDRNYDPSSGGKGDRSA